MSEQIKEVRLLRAKGLTYAQINSHLGVNVPKSTLSSWCYGVKLSEKHQKIITKARLEKLVVNRQKALAANKDKRNEYLLNLNKYYASLQNYLDKNRESFLIMLALLYLTEGSKQSGKLTFGNSDPRIIKLFLKLLRESFKIDEIKFRCTVQCRADQIQSELENFWSITTQIPKQNFYKTRVDPRSIGKVTLKEGYKGVCRIDYFSGYIYNELQAIINVITR